LHSLPAFPGAEGWGAETVGGRGGAVYVVTSTAAVGPGTFLAAIAQRRPRIIVFQTSGVINLTTSGLQVHEPYSNVTIAGQTSPGGITLTGKMAGNAIFYCYDKCRDQGQFHDGIFRFLRFRGNSSNNDAVTFEYANNFIFDHCDFSGAYDETQDFCYSHSFTLQWNTCANSSSGQTYGTLIAYADINRITMHHNLWANHVNRFPHMHWGYEAAPDQGLIDYRNNICFNWQIYTLSICCVSSDLKFNVVGNYFKCGNQNPAGESRPDVSGIPSGQLYSSDNIFHPKGGSPSQYDIGGSRSSANDMPAVTTYPALANFDSVLNKVGAWPRDIMNQRTVAEVRAGTGQYRKDNDPLITSGPAAPPDGDLDGMPDYWETAMGFNPGDSSDSRGDHDTDGYTNIEEYINDLALIFLGQAPHNPATGIEEVRAGNTAAIPNLALSVRPNPLAGAAQIKLMLNRVNRPVGKIQILDMQGRLVRSFSPKSAVRWNASQAAPGVYLVRWVDGARVRASRKMVVLP
jgi:pectate lyase